MVISLKFWKKNVLVDRGVLFCKAQEFFKSLFEISEQALRKFMFILFS